ncbi:MAG TPA: MarR family transcriptional regulator, partial [Candidatus Hydrogenedentes bacterium]|nr:MarR family transcriptional regulator [Candidatus Hydrogenedentota bacterium]
AVLFRQFDLTEAQFNVLFSLKFATGNVTQAELGKRLVVTRASVTSVLDKLESKKLVSRVNVPDNRRIHHVVLTEAGRSLIDKVEPIYREEIYAALEDIETDDCHKLIHQLENVRDRVRNH